MICRNCGVRLSGYSDKCPFCGNKLNTIEEDKNLKQESDELELPILKKNEDVELNANDVYLSNNDSEAEIEEKKEETEEIEEENDSSNEDDLFLEKTRSISLVEDNEEVSELSLIDDINRQIDDMNEESNLLENKEEENVISSQETKASDDAINELSTKSSFKFRRNILLVTGALCLLIALILFAFIYFKHSKEEAISEANYIENLNEALQKYYDTEEIDDVIYVLEDIKKDDDKIKEVQNRTRTVCDSWVLLYLNEEILDKEKFGEASNKYKRLIDGLHNDAMIRHNDIRIKALTDTDYEELSKQISDIYSDSSMFLEALNYYSNKDYNRAFYDFDRIDEKNFYYEKAVHYKNKIVDDIISLLKADIKKMENVVGELTDEEKLQEYLHIEEIILEYNNVYVSVNLSSDSTYQELLGTYTSYVALYTEKVSENNKIDSNQNNQENINQGNNLNEGSSIESE